MSYLLMRADFDAMVKMWSFVRRGLLTIKSKDKRSGHWTPEHVRALLEMGFKGQNTYELWWMCCDGDVIGFAVTCVQIDVWLSVPSSLFAWLIYLKPEHMHGFHAIREQFEAITKERGLRWFEGTSSREGWVKRLIPRGYEMHMTYRKDVWSDEP